MNNQQVLKALLDGKESLREMVIIHGGILWNKIEFKQDRFGNLATMLEILETEFRSRTMQGRKSTKKGGG